MSTDFSSFEASIRERRTYRDVSGLAQEIADDKGLAQHFTVKSTGPESAVTGTHVLNTGHPNPEKPFCALFGFEPPSDFTDFYRRWDGGFLFFGVPHKLLPIAKIIEENRDFRKLRGHPPKSQWKIIRFADIGHNDFIGFRQKEDRWVVSLILNEYHDDDLLAGEFEAPVLAQSFAGWIDRLIKKDGALPDGIPEPMPRIA